MIFRVEYLAIEKSKESKLEKRKFIEEMSLKKKKETANA